MYPEDALRTQLNGTRLLMATGRITHKDALHSAASVMVDPECPGPLRLDAQIFCAQIRDLIGMGDGSVRGMPVAA